MDDANPEGKQENTEDLSGAAPPDFLSAGPADFPSKGTKDFRNFHPPKTVVYKITAR